MCLLEFQSPCSYYPSVGLRVPALSLPPWRESPEATEPPAAVPLSPGPPPHPPEADHPELSLDPCPGSACPIHWARGGARAHGRTGRHSEDRQSRMEGGDSLSWASRGGSGFTRPSWHSRRRKQGREGQDHEEGGAMYRLRVGEWPKPVIVLLPSRVPQPQVHRLAVHHHIG